MKGITRINNRNHNCVALKMNYFSVLIVAILKHWIQKADPEL